jgi:SAM-dependent methyltransferase
VPPGEWEPDAETWVRWARRPEGDAYWFYRDAFFDEVLTAARGRTLEIGCGEGRVARDLAARGHAVAGIDTSHTLLRHARDADSAGAYARAGGASLPFRDACFHTVVAYNSLQVVDDMHATVQEAGRVLVDGGHLCACVSHPVTDLGRFSSDPPGFALRPAYFEVTRVEETENLEGGGTMTFRGWSYPLEAYATALEDAGLVIEVLREPRPPASTDRFARWRQVPLFLNFRAVKARKSPSP